MKRRRCSGLASYAEFICRHWSYIGDAETERVVANNSLGGRRYDVVRVNMLCTVWNSWTGCNELRGGCQRVGAGRDPV